MKRRHFLGVLAGTVAGTVPQPSAAPPAPAAPVGPLGLQTDGLGNIYQWRTAAQPYEAGDWFLNSYGKGVGLCMTTLAPGESGWVMVFRRRYDPRSYHTVTSEDTGLVWRDAHLPDRS